MSKKKNTQRCSTVIDYLCSGAETARRARRSPTGDINASEGDIGAARGRTAEDVVLVTVISDISTDVLEHDVGHSNGSSGLASGTSVFVILLDIDGITKGHKVSTRTCRTVFTTRAKGTHSEILLT